MAVETFIDEFEAVAEIVAERLKELVDDLVDSLAPDGRPLGYEKQSEREQLRDYEVNLRDNREAWALWIRTRVGKIQEQLMGQPPEIIASISPYDIAIKYALDFERKMEARLAREGRDIDAT